MVATLLYRFLSCWDVLVSRKVNFLRSISALQFCLYSKITNTHCLVQLFCLCICLSPLQRFNGAFVMESALQGDCRRKRREIHGRRFLSCAFTHFAQRSLCGGESVFVDCSHNINGLLRSLLSKASRDPHKL